MYELHHACQQGDLLLVKKLLAENHSHTQIDAHGHVPITYAVEFNHPEIASCIIEYEAEQSGTTLREKQVKKALSYNVIAHFFIAQNNNTSGFSLLTLAAQYLSLTPNKTDNELRLYNKVLQALIQTPPVLPIGKNLVVIERIINTTHQIRNKEEADHIIYIFFTEQIADYFSKSGLANKAKTYYIKSIACYRLLNAHAGQIFQKGLMAFHQLSKCYAEGSFENKFFKFAGDCLTKEFKDSLNLTKLLALISNKYAHNATLCRGAIELIKLLFHLYNLDTLNNKKLRNFFMEEKNQQQLKDFAYSLIVKPIDMAYCSEHFTVFASANFPKDTMHDNLPPTDLSKTYDWM